VLKDLCIKGRRKKGNPEINKRGGKTSESCSNDLPWPSIRIAFAERGTISWTFSLVKITWVAKWKNKMEESVSINEWEDFNSSHIIYLGGVNQ